MGRKWRIIEKICGDSGQTITKFLCFHIQKLKFRLHVCQFENKCSMLIRNLTYFAERWVIHGKRLDASNFYFLTWEIWMIDACPRNKNIIHSLLLCPR